MDVLKHYGYGKHLHKIFYSIIISAAMVAVFREVIQEMRNLKKS